MSRSRDVPEKSEVAGARGGRYLRRVARKPSPAEDRGLMKTSEVLEKSGVTRQMLYLYTTMGLVDPAETTGAGHRLYDPSVLEKLRIIRDAVETGYSLKDVKEIFFEPTSARRQNDGRK